MSTVTSYHIAFFGGSAGYQGARASIALADGMKGLGSIRFHDPGMTFPNDTQDPSGFIIMNLPSTMLESVVDMLRNEKPVSITFSLGMAYLSTGEYEPVGEAE